MVSAERVRAAAELARPYVRRTPLLPLASPGSASPPRRLKLELLQPTGSFKVRGFFAAALELPPPERARGLHTVSAGNAALACAYAAHRLGVPCRVRMFDTAPPPKLEGVRRWGAEAILLPRSDLLAWIAGRGWEAEPDNFIHPFADEAVQAGAGGIGLEILEQWPQVGRVVVPVGGGGLVAGVAAALKGSRPDVEVVGVQSEGYPLWPRTLAEGTPPRLEPATIADGTAAPYDPAMRALLEAAVDRWLSVPEQRLRAAVAGLARRAAVVAEGAGALAFAALELLADGTPTAAVVSGGNIDPALLAVLLGGEAAGRR